MFEYARTAAERGVRVIIAGAGGAAHLPGMVAALTPLPVVGVPLPFVSFGGTSIVTLLLGIGILSAISTEKRVLSR